MYRSHAGYIQYPTTIKFPIYNVKIGTRDRVSDEKFPTARSVYIMHGCIILVIIRTRGNVLLFRYEILSILFRTFRGFSLVCSTYRELTVAIDDFTYTHTYIYIYVHRYRYVGSSRVAA